MGRSTIGANERKAQLLRIMRAHREQAASMSEFSRTAIAHEAGVTPQYVSMLIGPEFHAAAQGFAWSASDRRNAFAASARGQQAAAPRTGAREAAAQRPYSAEH